MIRYGGERSLRALSLSWDDTEAGLPYSQNQEKENGEKGEKYTEKQQLQPVVAEVQGTIDSLLRAFGIVWFCPRGTYKPGGQQK